MPKTVQLSDDAYATLAALKRTGESFSDVVKRLAAERKDVRKLAEGPSWDLGVSFEELRRRTAGADRGRWERIWGPGGKAKRRR